MQTETNQREHEMDFSVKQKVLFRHCDPAGIVFYPRYFEMINDGVEAFFSEALGYPFEQMHETHGVPTVKINVAFRAASRHGDDLEISIIPQRVGGTSLELSIEATCEGEVRFQAAVTLVHVSKAMRSAAWPDAVRTKLVVRLNPKLKEETHV